MWKMLQNNTMNNVTVTALSESYGRELTVSKAMYQQQRKEKPPQSDVEHQMVLVKITGSQSDQDMVNSSALISISRIDNHEEPNNKVSNILKIGEPIAEVNVAHLAEVGACFRELFTHNHLCDVTIQINNDTFMVHKAILMAQSQYFCKLFFEEKKGQTTIQLTGIPLPTIQLVLEYMYTGKIALTMENTADIYTVAQKLVVTNLLTICDRKLHNLTSRNALIILHTASIKEADIFRRAFVIVVKSFQDIKDTQQLKMQRIDVFIMILASNDVVVATEMDVFNAAIAWLFADYHRRLKYIIQVLRQIRFYYITSNDLLNCTDTIKDFPTWSDIQPYLLKSMWYAMAIRHRRKTLIPITLPPERQYKSKPFETPTNINVNNATLQNHSLTRYRAKRAPTKDHSSTFAEYENSSRSMYKKTISTKSLMSTPLVKETDKAVIVVGGATLCTVMNAEEVGKSIYAYRPHDQTWKRVGCLPEARNFHAVAFMLDCLYVVGGARPVDKYERYYIPTEMVYKWNLRTKKWWKCASMKNKRIHHKVATLHHRLYALGGQDEHSKVLKCVEEFNPVLNRWEEVAPLRIGRIGMAVTSHNGKVIVAGGYNDICTSSMSSEPMLATVETYQQATNTWSFISDLPSPRFHCALLNVHDNLYLCGGAVCVYDPVEKKSRIVNVDNIYKYSFGTDRWQEFGSLKHNRHGAKAVVVGSKILVLGGVSLSTKETDMSMVESFDVHSGLSNFTDLGCLAQLAMGVAVCDAELLDGLSYLPDRQLITMI